MKIADSNLYHLQLWPIEGSPFCGPSAGGGGSGGDCEAGDRERNRESLMGIKERKEVPVLKLHTQRWVRNRPKQSLSNKCGWRKMATREALSATLGMNLLLRQRRVC